MVKDKWGAWANRIVWKQQAFLCLCWTFLNKVKCIFWKVALGKECRFWGKTYFRRATQSDITIGNYCRFRSSSWSNLVGVNRPCMLSTLQEDAKITIGNGCGFSGTVIGAALSISIGNDVLCGANVTITDTDWHRLDHSEKAPGSVLSSPVVIEESDRLGMNVTVLKGVSIGRGSVIAAGSVVVHDIPSGVIAGGNPAKLIRTLRNE